MKKKRQTIPCCSSCEPDQHATGGQGGEENRVDGKAGSAVKSGHYPKEDGCYPLFDKPECNGLLVQMDTKK
jgi:hypothetical protein